MDLNRVADACATECVRQNVGLVGLSNLLIGYKQILATGIHHAHDLTTLAYTVEPSNGGVFRTTPVTFANGGSSADHTTIAAQMNNCIIFIQQLMEDDKPDEWNINVVVKHFLWVHPFTDGNGRVGFLLYNYLMGTLDSPLALPDFGW